ncbi:class I SAM-dependent methyltransferase [Ornithinimicrobium faecis]|uniref:Class I SAM-dependent methyltransferase n=1 Tax=Ornithinimicrobium faecis TaxID=2934158 RepID=A0ABY4YUU8_9MICO|nr:class I SAM-dependent methyltransferase [Ornithinimicrobium sp. HY1793]USQ80030.1 class I SAM-dependent methyltransferase [Ornithinimicrobium sp. HY1793]
MEQVSIDTAIQEYYSRVFDEADRLVERSAQGALEFIRTQELVTERITPSSRIIDIGGASGVHAAPLADKGHSVLLLDPVQAQVDKAQERGTFEARVGDARHLDVDDNSFDVALLFGPLYHLHDLADRLLCLREASRVVRPRGWVFAAAIPRFSRHADFSLAQDVPVPYPQEWVQLLESGVPGSYGRFPAGHFHTGEELAQELAEAGLLEVEVHAIEGSAGLALEQISGTDPDLVEAALAIVRRTGSIPGIRDMTNHMMGIARVA